MNLIKKAALLTASFAALAMTAQSTFSAPADKNWPTVGGDLGQSK